jgi:large repetitive protein
MRKTVLFLASIALGVLLASGAALAATKTFSNNAQIRIPAEGQAIPYPSEINVGGLGTRITDLNLRLNNFSHTFPDDVSVLLVGPQNQKSLPMSDVGGEFRVTNATLVLDDEASLFLPDNGQIFGGTYAPTQGPAGPSSGQGNPTPTSFPSPAPAGPYDRSLDLFDGTNPNGTWELYVFDDSIDGFGEFAGGWSLVVTTDTTAPRVRGTAPAANATGISPTANVTATFSEAMKAASVNGTTFELFRQGSATKVGASVNYNASTREGILNPTNSLSRGGTYKAVVTTFAQDRSGNRLDQNATLSGLQQKVWSFKVRN